jgi:RND family efflux transporter MFP subunit
VRVVPVLVKPDDTAVAAGDVVVQAPGWVEADPFPTAVSALADGVVEDVLVLEGQRVHAGQVVARLVDEDARIALNHAEAILAERRAALAAAHAERDEARRNWEHPIELTRALQTSEAQLAEKRATLERWPAELALTEAHAVYLKAEHDRVAPLYADAQANEIELIQAKQAYAAQLAAVEAERRRKPVLEAQIRALEAEVAAAEENLRLRIADTRAVAEAEAAVKRAEAAIASAEARRDEAALRLERMEVRASTGGIVMIRLVEPGSKLMLQGDVPRSAQVVRLYDPEKLQVRVDVPLVEAAKVGVGQQAEVIVDVLPDRVFRGHVTRLVHEADVQKNTLQVKVAIKAPSSEIKPEMLARARFLGSPDAGQNDAAGSAGQRVFVPRKSIVQRDDGSFVWLADQVDRVARLRRVTPGQVVVDDWIAISEGLQAGDRVVIDAPTDLRDGQRIRLIEDARTG